MHPDYERSRWQPHGRRRGGLGMNKTLEALLRGYLFFDVNGKRFLTYNAARAERVATTGDVYFVGWHIFKGWRCFYKRVTT